MTDRNLSSNMAGGASSLKPSVVSEPFARGGEARAVSLRSDHLYQLFAYLTNHARSYPAEPPALGVLLYATVGATLDYRYRVHGHPLWVWSVDLAKPWPAIRDGLDRLADALCEKQGPNTRAAA